MTSRIVLRSFVSPFNFYTLHVRRRFFLKWSFKRLISPTMPPIMGLLPLFLELLFLTTPLDDCIDIISLTCSCETGVRVVSRWCSTWLTSAPALPAYCTTWYHVFWSGPLKDTASPGALCSSFNYGSSSVPIRDIRMFADGWLWNS